MAACCARPAACLFQKTDKSAQNLKWVEKRAKNTKNGWKNVKVSLFQWNKREKHTLFQGKVYKSLKYLKSNFKIAKLKDRK